MLGRGIIFIGIFLFCCGSLLSQPSSDTTKYKVRSIKVKKIDTSNQNFISGIDGTVQPIFIPRPIIPPDSTFKYYKFLRFYDDDRLYYLTSYDSLLIFNSTSLKSRWYNMPSRGHINSKKRKNSRDKFIRKVQEKGFAKFKTYEVLKHELNSSRKRGYFNFVVESDTMEVHVGYKKEIENRRYDSILFWRSYSHYYLLGNKSENILLGNFQTTSRVDSINKWYLEFILNNESNPELYLYRGHETEPELIEYTLNENANRIIINIDDKDCKGRISGYRKNRFRANAKNELYKTIQLKYNRKIITFRKVSDEMFLPKIVKKKSK